MIQAGPEVCMPVSGSEIGSVCIGIIIVFSFDLWAFNVLIVWLVKYPLS